jgi:hypothetical protein
MKTLWRLVRVLIDVFSVLRSVLSYFLISVRPNTSQRLSLLRLHCATNGWISWFLARCFKLVYPKRPLESATGLVGELSVSKQREIVSKLDQDGYFVFPKQLPTALCDQIEKFASKTPAKVEGQDQPNQLFDPKKPVSITYRLDESLIARHEGIQILMSDPALLSVAEGYLGSTPNLSMLNLWWSAAYGNKPGSDAAQFFHFDFDPPPKWLLIFVYLTDVGTKNGPHVFVRGSHKAGHPEGKKILRKGYVRIPDKEIEQSFGEENIVELTGKRGTVIAVDTRGFHKGKMLVEGHRLMAQLTFSFPVFAGSHGGVQSINNIKHHNLAAALENNPRVFSRYFSTSSAKT